jgi:tRNA splicing endonuclease
MDRLETELTSFVSEVHQDIAEMRQWRVQSQKHWGEIAKKIGAFVEDVVAPNIPRLGHEIFQLGSEDNEQFSGPRLRVRHPKDKSRLREFDYVYVTNTGWIVVESKNDPKLKDVDEFRTVLAEVREFFPQFAHLPLYAVFASLYVPGHVVKYCTRHKIYALGMGAETMQILNLSELPPAPQASEGG